MNARKLKLLSTLATLIIGGLLVAYVVANWSEIKAVIQLDYVYIPLAIATFTLTILTNAIFLQVVLKKFERHISLGAATEVTVRSSLANYFAPAGTGLGYKAIYLKRKHNLPYSEYVALQMGNYVLLFITIALTGLLAVAARGVKDPSSLTLGVLFGGLLLGSLVLIGLSKWPGVLERALNASHRNRILSRSLRILQQIVKGWTTITHDGSLIRRLLTILLLNQVIMVAVSYFIFLALGITVSLEGVVIYSLIGALSFFISITPGNLGVKEAILAATATTIGFGSNQIIAVSLAERFVVFIGMLAAWVILKPIIKLLKLT